MVGRRTLQWAQKVRNHRALKTIAENTETRFENIGTTLEDFHRNAGIVTAAEREEQAGARKHQALEDLADGREGSDS